MFKIKSRALSIAACLLVSTNAAADFSCAEAPNTDYATNGGRSHIEMRDAGIEYVLINNSSLIRTDTHTFEAPEVYYYYNQNPAYGPSDGNYVIPFAVDSANYFNGHSSARYTFDELGHHKIYAAIGDNASLNSTSWTCNGFDDAFCSASCPAWDPSTRSANGCVQTFSYGSDETLCAFKKYTVQTKPTINLNSTSVTSQGITVNTTYHVDRKSKVKIEGGVPYIRYHLQNVDYPNVPAISVGSTSSTKRITPQYRGQYKISVSVFDGTYTSSRAIGYAYFPYGTSCTTCGQIY